jgi:hypothetical protein
MSSIALFSGVAYAIAGTLSHYIDVLVNEPQSVEIAASLCNDATSKHTITIGLCSDSCPERSGQTEQHTPV